MRQILKQGQLNFRVFFHDFADSQRVPFYARFAGAILRLRFCGCGFAGAILQEKHDGLPPFSKRTTSSNLAGERIGLTRVWYA